MNRSSSPLLGLLFSLVLGLTVIVYLLRGFGLLTFLPGGIILILLTSSLALGICYAIQKTGNY